VKPTGLKSEGESTPTAAQLLVPCGNYDKSDDSVCISTCSFIGCRCQKRRNEPDYAVLRCSSPERDESRIREYCSRTSGYRYGTYYGKWTVQQISITHLTFAPPPPPPNVSYTKYVCFFTQHRCRLWYLE